MSAPRNCDLRHPEATTRHPEATTRHPETTTRHPETTTRHPERSEGSRPEEIAEPVLNEVKDPPPRND